jgi:ferrous iron transport protein A
MIPLGLMREGEKGVISKILSEEALARVGHPEKKCEGGCLFCKKQMGKIKSLGLKAGMPIRVLKNEPGFPLLIMFENTQIALSRGLAMKILIERI